MYNRVKPILDRFFAFIGLLILSPLFIIIGLAIKIESKGPILFTQTRVGQGSGFFKIYKFRTMRVGTPDIPTHLLTDPAVYVTKIGKYLRKSSLDELPQLVNILLGEMSFVGPRPALHNQFELIEDRKTMGIDKVKPGVTGYAQIMGRDEISDKQKVIYDRHYVESLSFSMDCGIVFKTLIQVSKTQGVKG